MQDAPHEKHFAACEPAVRDRLRAVQAEIERRVPGAEPCIGYKMPAYRLGRIFFYFAGFKRHIGVYPPVNGTEYLMARLAPYRGPKGNLTFPHKDPLPLDLIGDVAEQLVAQYGSCVDVDVLALLDQQEAQHRRRDGDNDRIP